MPRRRALEAIAAAALVVTLAACGGAVGSPAGPTTSGPGTTNAPTGADATATVATPAVTQAPLETLPLLWEATGEPALSGFRAGTYSPAVDPLTGDIWVAVSPANVIWVFSKDGVFKSAFGEPGTEAGAFNFKRSACPDCPGAGGLAFAPDGTLFVADVGNHRIQKFDQKHVFVKAWGSFGAGDGQFADAIQIAATAREVFVSDDARRDVQVFDLDGTFLRKLPISGWVTPDPSGNMLVSDEGTVSVLDASGKVITTHVLPAYRGYFHIGLAVDASGRLFYDYQDDRTGNAMGLGSFDPATGKSQIWASGGETIVIAGGVLYVSNYTSAGWQGALLRAYSVPGL